MSQIRYIIFERMTRLRFLKNLVSLTAWRIPFGRQREADIGVNRAQKGSAFFIVFILGGGGEDGALRGGLGGRRFLTEEG